MWTPPKEMSFSRSVVQSSSGGKGLTIRISEAAACAEGALMRVAVIGLGQIGRGAAMSLARVGGFDLVGYDPVPEALERAAGVLTPAGSVAVVGSSGSVIVSTGEGGREPSARLRALVRRRRYDQCPTPTPSARGAINIAIMTGAMISASTQLGQPDETMP